MGLIDRPDPGSGKEAGCTYARLYENSHATHNDSPMYRLGYAWYLLLDRILPNSYSLLDVGCGTGGYHRLLKNSGKIVGLDFSREMIAVANEFRIRNNVMNAEYCAQKFEDYQTTSTFDVVSLVGVYGSYVPWHGREDILSSTRSLLNPNGIACFSYVPPRSLTGLVKSALFRRKTVNLRKSTFHRMLTSAGFSPLIELVYPHAAIVIARKTTEQQGANGE